MSEKKENVFGIAQIRYGERTHPIISGMSSQIFNS